MKCVCCQKKINQKDHHLHVTIDRRKYYACAVCGEVDGPFEQWLDEQPEEDLPAPVINFGEKRINCNCNPGLSAWGLHHHSNCPSLKGIDQ